MTVSTVLVVGAAAAALILVTQTQQRTFAVLALVVAAVQALLHFRMLAVSAGGVPLGLVLSGTLTVCGAIAWSQTNEKLSVSAATVVLAAGAVQVLALLF